MDGWDFYVKEDAAHLGFVRDCVDVEGFCGLFAKVWVLMGVVEGGWSGAEVCGGERQ